MKKAFVIGQAPPRIDAGRPFGRTALYRWFAEAGISEEAIAASFSFGALVDFFPGMRGGSHRPPSPVEIAAARPALLERIRALQPDVVVPVGTLAIREALGDPAIRLEAAVGQAFITDPFGALGRLAAIVPLPHPSGANPWVYLNDNRSLLDRGLGLLRESVR